MYRTFSTFKHYRFIHLVAFSLLLILVACEDEPEDFATFTFKENLGVPYNSEAEVEIEPLVDGLKLIELQIGDSIVSKWNNPGMKKVKYTLKSTDFGIGAKKIIVIAHNQNGEQFKDERTLRVLSDLQPELWAYEVLSTFPHNIANFTQGFEFSGDQLYESTGQRGESKIAKIDIATGNDLSKIGLDATHFGEGITIFGDTVYQLTWTTNKCFLYDRNTLQILPKEYTYQGEGWGLCNDGKYLIMSDGTERLTFRDPKTFAVVKTIEVYTHEQPVTRLNELEYIDGLIYANIWMTNNIAAIEPETGRVIGVIDGSTLVPIGRGKVGDVFNGIAYNKTQDAIYVTGKNWEKTIKIKLKDKYEKVIASN
ncbi:glutaminyl-peptide cyclotransferase [Crocinitomicaceae bacterium CZZ-1]|uniref:Glutaminyl-peptide cyclotransferase n=1 Tax=Taishania pollutisoli TaxID=2766479 RepID=A0A8J6P6E1_9FLAO|nr:glutaminyl-peptide cyclotransferase [Taishania pollutisoli]MBC9812737.1 glutaminyl-peptide cyclotransferase [Taishania pollutisoli]MBX2949107.1 glutaminyl-peptide cyclotransferase [Crocinitomicaceae bacterium]NGF75963.1 glutaminyl-peptide cyclotransferase [Fluviicola sp. SGL-29]